MKNFWQKLKKPIIAVAPMAGYTDSAFRLICRKYGADVVYTEMISADALHYDAKKTLEMLKFNKKEKPVVCQLFGKRPEMFAKAVKIVESFGYDGIDINFGCPARKVVAHGGGVTLMRDLDNCYEIIKIVCEAAKVPVSIKIRASIKKGEQIIYATDLIEKIKDLPVAAVMIHGRSYEGGFSGPVDFEMIKKVKETFKGIVLGNGGIDSPEATKKMIDKTGVDGVGLARGLWKKPYLGKLIKEYLKKGDYKNWDLRKIKKMAIEHAKLMFETKGNKGIMEMRKFLLFYFKGFPNASEARQRLVKVETLKDVEKVLKEI
ncbi:MAG TPA: tRNA-dihydrouridine synthase [Candidatus Bipolaricaulota bacterium]|nr:tRNA-dihydrouridine synthase [Candidatus Bipolaricaulota bacterium]